MSDFLKQLVDEAHTAYINNMFDECIKILKAIKFRVGTKELFDEMNTKDAEYDKMYSTKINEILLNKTDDLTYTNMKVDLKKTQAQRYLSFYSRIVERIP